MPYLCYCKDNPNSAELRDRHTPAHLRYIESIIDHVLVAGPLVNEETGVYNNSCFIYQVDTREEALELLHNDPYYIAGIYAEVSCQSFVPAAGEWIGGTIW